MYIFVFCIRYTGCEGQRDINTHGGGCVLIKEVCIVRLPVSENVGMTAKNDSHAYISVNF